MGRSFAAGGSGGGVQRGVWTMANIKIGPEFFKKAFNDYGDRYHAWTREIYQNGVDAPGCSRIEFTIYTDDGNTIAVVENNGEPMTEEILINKLLCLGGSGKTGNGTVGGFGKAKEIIMLAHPGYEILTGDLVVVGCGGEYEVSQSGSNLAGTRTTVTWDGDHTDRLIEQVRKLAKHAQWGGSLYLNGERLTTDLRKGSRRKEFDWGVVYSNKSDQNRIVVRVGGIPMFTRHTSFPGCLVIELKGNSKDVLTSNRDGLCGKYAYELSDFITAISVDTKSALREQKAEYKRYLGAKIRAEKMEPKAAEITIDRLVDVAAIAALSGTNIQLPVQDSLPGSTSVISAEDVHSVGLGHQFILKTTCGMEIPAYYQPGDAFSKYSRELVRVWIGSLVKIYEILGVGGQFSVGFIFDEDREAEFEEGEYGKVYYLNPSVLVSQKDKPQCRSFRARYTGAWTDRFQILAVAVHEAVHGIYGLTAHNEEYASQLTLAMAIVFSRIKEFNPVFKGH